MASQDGYVLSSSDWRPQGCPADLAEQQDASIKRIAGKVRQWGIQPSCAAFADETYLNYGNIKSEFLPLTVVVLLYCTSACNCMCICVWSGSNVDSDLDLMHR